MSAAATPPPPPLPTGSTAHASSPAAAALTVPVTVVSSVEEFQSIFSGPAQSGGDSGSRDAFLLCYEHPADHVTAEALSEFKTRVQEAVRQHGTRLSLFLWDCTSPAFDAAKAQLGKQAGQPLMLIIYHGAIADSICDTPIEEMSAMEVPRICSRLASFQTSAKPARVVTAQHGGATSGSPQQQRLSVDVAKMVGIGKKLMADHQPLYAEKCFVKAIHTLDAVAAEVDCLVTSLDDYDGSLALCLAWAGMAHLVQGPGTAAHNVYLARLDETPSLEKFRTEPMSEANRALTTRALMRHAPRPWTEETCSESKLRAALQANPQDASSRCLLVTTLFLKGDLQRSLTEALKLQVSGIAYGGVALEHLSDFLGREHALVRQLGIPALTEVEKA